MADPATRLTPADEPALSRLLARSPVVNLFLRGFLHAHPVDRAWWYGVGRPLRATALAVPSRLVVPFAPDPADAATLGLHLAENHAPTLLVGPREAADALWSRWTADAAPTRWHDQRLYVVEQVSALEAPPGLRVARLEDEDAVALGAARMEMEDLGTDPRTDDARHREAVRERIRTGRTYVVERGGEIVFQVNVGNVHPDGCQIGGTWVPPEHRGRGLGAAGVAAVCRILLRASPRVTLHVDEGNTPAVRAYVRAGFRPDAALRLIVP